MKKNMFLLFGLRAVAAAALTGVILMPGRASTLLELDFQNYSSGVTTANTVTSGASGDFTLSGTTGTINPTGSTGITTGNADLTSGYMTNLRTTSFNTSLVSTNTAGSGNNAEYADYIGGGNGYGTATVEMLFKPNFTGLNSGIGFSSTNILFGTSDSSQSKVVRLYFGAGTEASGNVNTKLTLQLGSSSTNSFLMSSAITLDMTKWYYIAASWTAGDEYTLYIREVTSATGSMALSASSLTNYAYSMNLPLYIGSRDAGANPMNGEMSYFRWTNDYTDTTAEYDARFSALITPVPEPGATGLLLGAGVAMGFLLRRRYSC